MRKATVVITLTLFCFFILITSGIHAETWDSRDYFTDDETGEKALEITITIKGPDTAYQGQKDIEYTTKFEVTLWDSDLEFFDDLEGISVDYLVVEIEGSEDLEFSKQKWTFDPEELFTGEGVYRTKKFELDFAETLEDQEVDIKAIWTYTLHYRTWYGYEYSYDYHASVYAYVDLSEEYAPDVTPPTVTILEPADGAKVSGSIVIKAEVTDDKSGVVRVEVRIGSGSWYRMASESENIYTYGWDTTEVDDDSYTISVRAYDKAGNSATESISVTVQNMFGGIPGFCIGTILIAVIPITALLSLAAYKKRR